MGWSRNAAFEVTAVSKKVKAAQATVEKIHSDGAHFRRDIAASRLPWKEASSVGRLAR